jgi:hypothetical protein
MVPYKLHFDIIDACPRIVRIQWGQEFLLIQLRAELLVLSSRGILLLFLNTATFEASINEISELVEDVEWRLSRSGKARPHHGDGRGVEDNRGKGGRLEEVDRL